MKLVLEQNQKTYHCIEDNSSLLTVVTNKEPGTVCCLLTQVIKGKQFPEIEYRQLPYGGTGILHDPYNCVIHTNVPEGYYYAYIRLKHLYFRYQHSNSCFYDSFSEIQAEIWEAPLEVFELVNKEKKALNDLHLEKKLIRKEIFERIILLIGFFLAIATMVYPLTKNQVLRCKFAGIIGCATGVEWRSPEKIK